MGEMFICGMDIVDGAFNIRDADSLVNGIEDRVYVFLNH